MFTGNVVTTKDYSHVVAPESWDLDDDLVEWYNRYNNVRH